MLSPLLHSQWAPARLGGFAVLRLHERVLPTSSTYLGFGPAVPRPFVGLPMTISARFMNGCVHAAIHAAKKTEPRASRIGVAPGDSLRHGQW